MGVRGATWKHVFRLPFSIDLAEKMEIAYSQDDRNIITKNLEDCTIIDGKIHVKLSQEETLMFDGDKIATVRVRVLDRIGNAPISKEKSFIVFPSNFTKPLTKE